MNEQQETSKNRNLSKNSSLSRKLFKNCLLLAIISVSAFQMFISSSLFWTISTVIGSVAKVLITWKTRNIYGAAFMSIIANLIDIFIQVV